MGSMDLLLIRSLLSVVEHGAITEAAKSLGLTQPSLSRRIQSLEEELGAPLLVRSRKGVALTELGRLVEREGRILVARWQSMKDNLQAHLSLEAGVVRIGGGATAVSFLLPEAIASFQRSHPGVRFEVKEAGSRDVELEVAAERLELGIVTMPLRVQRAADLEVTPLATDEIVLVAAAGHPLTSKRRLNARALQGQSVVGFESGSAIRQLIDAALRDAGVQVEVPTVLRSIPAILQMVATTGSLAFVSQLSLPGADSRFCVLKVRGLRICRQLAVINKRGRPLSPAAAAFASRLRDHRAKDTASRG